MAHRSKPTPGVPFEKTPEGEANCLSRIFFSWPHAVFERGNVRVPVKEPSGGAVAVGGKPATQQYSLQAVDMFPLVEDDQAAHLVKSFEAGYAKEDRDGHGVWRVLKAMLGREFFWVGVVKFFNSSLQFVPSILLNLFLSRLEQLTDGDAASRPPAWEAYVIGVGLFLTLSIKTLTENAYFHGGTRVGFKARSTVTTAIYRKALRLSPAARQGTKEGSIVQLMNVDAERFNAVAPQLHNLWDGIYQILGYMVLLTVYIGPAAAFSGLASMLLLIPINLCMHGRLMSLRKSISSLTDERVQATNEALQGVRAIKLYGWETAFEQSIAEIRSRELSKVRSAAITNAAVFTFMQAAPIIVAVVTLIVYAAVSPTFTASTVFTAMTILTQLRFPLMFYPMVIFLSSAASVSLGRIEKFMAAPEVAHADVGGDDGSVAIPASSDGARATAVKGEELATRSDTVVAVRGGRFWWSDPANPVVDLLGEKDEKKKKKEEATAGAQPDGKPDEKSGDEAAGHDSKAAARASAGAEPASASASAPAAGEANEGDEEDGSTKAIVERPILDDIFFGVPKGQLLAVVGAVGSGKSALCSALLGELHKEQGSVSIDGSVAFCAQRSWILNATVQKNILFAEPFDEKRYKDALHVCQLEDDLKQLPAGDQTEIGERGVNLSGGQKQRVSVARACYSKSDIIILDDVLSALDPEVGMRLFEQCILGSMSGRTRVMVTNQVHVLEHCDLILELEQEGDGTARVGRLGTFRELMADDVFRRRVEEYAASAAAKHAAELEAEEKAAAEAAAASPSLGPAASAGSVPSADLSAAAKTDGADGEAEAAAAAAAAAEAAAEAATEAAEASSSSSSAAAATAAPTPSGDAGAKGEDDDAVAQVPDGDARPGTGSKTTKKPIGPLDAAAGDPATPGGQLISAETKEQGAVALRFYAEWLRAGSGSWWVATGIWLVFVSMINQFGMLSSNFWVSLWSSDPQYQMLPMGGYMGVFAALGVASALLGMLRLIFFVQAGLAASREMHANLFHSVIFAPMSFFDTTPLGRVMARFSKDMDAVDFNLASQLGMLAMTAFLIIGSIASIVYATPWFAVAIVPLCYIYARISGYFRNVSRECKRVDSVTRSPIYAHFGESLGGLSTIRAYGEGHRFSILNEKYVNTNASAWYTLRSCDRWLSVRLEILGNTIVLLSALLAASTAEAEANAGRTTASGTIGIAALSGFALSFSLSLTSVLNWAIRTLAETENMMNSVERITITSEETPQEPQGVPEGAPAVSDDWAASGRIEFKDVKMRYRPDAPEVLHGVSFTINPGEKVGIVGRSGSGKSTIMQVLFRIPIDSCVSGSVQVDGRDTKTVGLHTLRQRLSIIPQESVMFSGPMRDNLDPSGEVRACAEAEGRDADAQMVAALRDVGLESKVMEKGGLDAKVAEFGENWSAGERQLLSLARVLLRESKILCLDEVSSSVDSDTDKRMHETIQKRFSDRTVLTIAHRLHTVIKSDRVIVMHDGKLVEFDHPHTLLSDPDSRFSSLVSDTGAAASGLREMAKQSWEEKHGAGGASTESIAVE